ncbi:hypothetical protein DIE15_12215 [Burkholderia sp. Bp9031]|uniref:glucosaminidase domain-containing protein n=1 Tax=Burkholderia sp. Bp9031 TaxID=2184566 RepID=UPI000F5D85E8|nr:glucosaminidase domain-containing protein [Burkholderia sp. Bp9031]RQZ17231.1 hypothetical protein DIE15_12215 [Burkholderia sp. Bp9031]
MANVQGFVQQYGPVAAAVSQRIGVAPDVLLGQWGLETGWGKSVIPGTNNLGNIKGPGVAAKDNQTGAVDQYRTYQSPGDFAADFANLISSNYRNAVGKGADAAGYAGALKAGGYAEDPKYVGKLATAVDMVRKFGDTVASALSGAANAGELTPAQMGGAPVISATGQRLNGPQSAAAPAQAWSAPAVASPGDPLLDMAHGIMGGTTPGGVSPSASAVPSTKPAQTTDDPLLSMASNVMAAKPTSQPQQAPQANQPHETTPLDVAGAAVEPIATLATGALGGLVGGVARLGSAALGSSYADAQATGNKIADALTYHPQTQGGQQALAGLGNMASSAKNAIMNTPVGQAAAAVGKAYDDTFVKGAPNALLATINDQVPAATANIVAPELAARVNGLVKSIGRADLPAPTPGSIPWSDARGAGPSPAPAPNAAATPAVAPSGSVQAAVPPGAAAAAGGARGSMGAAGTSFANQARAEGVPDSLVQKIAAQEQAGTLNPTAAERHIEAGSLPVPVELTAGQATGDVNLLSHEQNIRGKAPELAERFNAQNGQLAANFDAIRDRVAPDVNVPSGTPIGQALVDAYKQADAPIQEQIARAYEGARNADGTPALVDSAGAMRDFESEIGPTRFRALPARVQQIFSDAKNNVVALPEAFDRSAGATRPLTARDLMDIDQTLSGAIGETKNTSVQHDIGLLRQAILDAPISPAAGPEAMAAFKSAQAQARARFQAMASDPAYKAAVNDGVGAGEPSPLADGFVQKYVAGGKTANVQNMLQNLSSDPLNQQYIAAGLLDHVKSQAGIDLRTGTGNVSQAALNKTIQNLGQKSGIVFGGDNAQILDKLGNVARYTQEQPRGSYVNNSNTFVAGAANAAKSALEGAANVYAHGIPVGTWARQHLAKRSLGKEAAQSLEPGAGLNKLKSAVGKN